MNTNTSYSWVKEWIKTDLSADEFGKEISLIGNEVEKKTHPDKYLNKVVVGKVLEISKHPQADKLAIAKTQIATDKIVQIVCGGTNLEEGQIVAVALPGATVSWHGEEEVTLEETKIRGEESFGMICAAEEIGFNKLAKEGEIWDLTEILKDKELGTPLAKALEVENETIFEQEITTNRPDTMSIIGQAREGYGKGLGEMTDPMTTPVKIEEGTGKELKVALEASDKCPRYMGLVLEVKVSPSPWWMQKRLLLAGAKPINNIVDITNYVRLELGQPLHAFDYDKIAGAEIKIRNAKDGEHFTALDGSEHELTSEMLVIADAENPVALAGIMGGASSGVTDQTKTIILESASFSPVSIRKTWRKLNLQSDSQTLYEKGLSEKLPEYGMHRAIELLKQVAEAKVVSNLEDKHEAEYRNPEFDLDPQKVNALIGIEIEETEQLGILERLGFTIKKEEKAYKVTVPFWRDKDIEASVDLAEEIARIYGYSSIKATLPEGEIPLRDRDISLDLENKIKDILVGIGCTEIFSNSFVDPEDVKRLEINPKSWLNISNPLAIDQSVLRASLLPSILRTIADNQNYGGIERLFELQRVFVPQDNDLPLEKAMLLISVQSTGSAEQQFREARGIIETLEAKLHFELDLERSTTTERLHPGRTAVILANKEKIGTIGQLHPTIQTAFAIDSQTTLIEIDIAKLLPQTKDVATYKKSSNQPAALRDIAVVVGEQQTFESLEKTIQDASNLITDIQLFDIYRGEQIELGKKSLAFKLKIVHSDKTLTTQEIDEVINSVKNQLITNNEATIRD